MEQGNMEYESVGVISEQDCLAMDSIKKLTCLLESSALEETELSSSVLSLTGYLTSRNTQVVCAALSGIIGVARKEDLIDQFNFLGIFDPVIFKCRDLVEQCAWEMDDDCLELLKLISMFFDAMAQYSEIGVDMLIEAEIAETLISLAMHEVNQVKEYAVRAISSVITKGNESHLHVILDQGLIERMPEFNFPTFNRGMQFLLKAFDSALLEGNEDHFGYLYNDRKRLNIFLMTLLDLYLHGMNESIQLKAGETLINFRKGALKNGIREDEINERLALLSITPEMLDAAQTALKDASSRVKITQFAESFGMMSVNQEE